MKREEKIRRTSHITDPNLKDKMFRVIDIIESVQYSHQSKYTEFLTPYEQKVAFSLAEGFDGICASLQGGMEASERKILYLYPDYEEDIGRDFLSCLKVSGNFNFRRVGHRDYLGSVLSLGIKREMLGDIFVNDDSAYVICLMSMKDYISFHLEKVANVRVKVDVVEWNEVLNILPKGKEKIFVVNSLRLDSVVAGMFDLSRAQAQKLIDAERVQVDYQIWNHSSKQIEPPSVISAKGYGKGRAEEVIGQTRKDKWRLRTLLYQG